MKYTAQTLYTAEQVSDITGVKTGTLSNWRSRGEGPAWLKCGRKIWYPIADFESWMEGLRVATKETERKLAIPFSSERQKILRNHRFGRHRTKQDESLANRGASAPAGDGRPGGTAETGGVSVQ